jgi:hypothetical protein
LYEAFRLESPNITEPYDIVVTVFNEQLATISGEEVKKLVHAQLRQAKIL